MTKIKTTEIPNHAKHLYIQLYCEKKGGQTCENIHNASQSWLSLSLTKKQHFYSTISTKTAVKKAQRIIKTEPYLRAKFPSTTRNRRSFTSKRLQNNEESNPKHVCDDNVMDCDNSSTTFGRQDNLSETLSETALDAENDILLQEECELEETQNENESRSEAGSNTLQESVEEHRLESTQNKPQDTVTQKLKNLYMSVVDEDTNSSKEDNTCGKEENVLSEPILPITKTGKDLFELLKTRNGITKPYDALTVREKRYYGHAVRVIKKDYVQKFKEYLESLSSRQLYDYSRKIFQ